MRRNCAFSTHDVHPVYTDDYLLALMMSCTISICFHSHFSDVFNEVAVGTRQDKVKPLVADPQGIVQILSSLL